MVCCVRVVRMTPPPDRCHHDRAGDRGQHEDRRVEYHPGGWQGAHALLRSWLYRFVQPGELVLPQLCDASPVLNTGFPAEVNSIYKTPFVEPL